MNKLVAIDIGGTFTDIVIYEGELKIKKILTGKNPKSLLENLLKELKSYTIFHATTLATNLILTKQGLPKVAFFATKGFSDIIEIARQNRPKLYDLYFEKPKPLVDKETRFEIEERTDVKGRIITKLNEEELEKSSIEALKKGAVSLAICFLHSYANSENEKRAQEIARKYFRYISASHEVAPEPREYERASTTVINAILMPVIAEYLEVFDEVYMMSNAGGLIDKEEAIKRPVQIIESGPAAGAIAASVLANDLGIKNVISLDIGGTTAKACAIIDNEPLITSEYEVGGEVHHGRIVKGSGYPIRFPFIDLAEVSAGGGTIIWRDEGGALRIGPMSAGSDPGPACYGLGGENATITDANLTLNRIGEEISGFKINKELALRALGKLGDPIEISLDSIRLADLEVARAIRLVTVERGYDPSVFSLMAFGGLGPQHACSLAEELGIRKIIIPAHPGVFSSLGMLVCDEKMEMRSKPKEDLEGSFRDLEDKLLKKLGNVSHFLRFADMRYKGQGWEIIVNLPRPCSYEEAFRIFEGRHLAHYGFKLDREIEILTIRVFAIKKKAISFKDLFKKRPVKKEETRYRKVYLEELEEVPIYKRESLETGSEIEGPAIIEEYTTSTVLLKGWKAKIGDYYMLLEK